MSGATSPLPEPDRTGWHWIDPLEDPAWDEWAGRHPRVSPFHLSGWARVLQQSYGYGLHYALLDTGCDFPALIPACEVASLITGRRGSCLPFTDECGPLLPPNSAHDDTGGGRRVASELLAPLLAVGRRRGWRYLELRSDCGPGVRRGDVARYLAHELDLEPCDDAQFAKLSAHHRRHVRRARRAGVEVHWHHDEAAMAAYYDLHCRTRKRLGVPPQPARFFRAVHAHLIAAGHGTVGLAHDDDRTVAGALFLHAGRSAWYKFGASLLESRTHSPNHLLMWEAIQRYRASGFKTLSFGRTDLQAAGLASFKRGWGARERTLVYQRLALDERTALDERIAQDQRGAIAGRHRHDALARRGPSAVGDPVAGAARIGRRIFQVMPVPVLRLCGDLAYPHLG